MVMSIDQYDFGTGRISVDTHGNNNSTGGTTTATLTTALVPTEIDLIYAAAINYWTSTVFTLTAGFAARYDINGNYAVGFGLVVEDLANLLASVNPTIVQNISNPWSLSGVAFVAAPSAAAISGGSPLSAVVGIQITAPFTVTLDQPAQAGGVVVTLAGSLAGDTFQASLGGGNVSTVTVSQGSSTVQFYFTPGTVGTDSVSISTTLGSSGSPLAVSVYATAASTYTLTGPSTGYTGISQTFTVQPNGPFTGSIILTPGGPPAIGLTSQTVTYSTSSAAKTAAFTCTAAGTLVVTPTNTGGLTNPSPATDAITGRR